MDKPRIFLGSSVLQAKLLQARGLEDAEVRDGPMPTNPATGASKRLITSSGQRSPSVRRLFGRRVPRFRTRLSRSQKDPQPSAEFWLPADSRQGDPCFAYRGLEQSMASAQGATPVRSAGASRSLRPRNVSASRLMLCLLPGSRAKSGRTLLEDLFAGRASCGHRSSR